MRVEARLDQKRYTAVTEEVNVRNYFEHSSQRLNGVASPVCACCTKEIITGISRCRPDCLPDVLQKYVPYYLNPSDWRLLCSRCGAFCNSGAPVAIDPELYRLWAEELKNLEDKTFVTELRSALSKGVQHCVGTSGVKHTHLDGLSTTVKRLLKSRAAKQLQKHLYGLNVRYADAQAYGPSVINRVPALVEFDRLTLTQGMGNGTNYFANQLVAVEMPARYGYVPRITFDLETAVMPKHTRSIMLILAVLHTEDRAILRYYHAGDITQLRRDMTEFTRLNESAGTERDAA